MTAYYKAVFPAYAGVIPGIGMIVISHLSIPRVCGGDPHEGILEVPGLWYSPRMRG